MSIYTFYPKISYKVDDYDSLRAIDITSSLKIKDYFKVLLINLHNQAAVDFQFDNKWAKYNDWICKKQWDF